MWIQIAKNEEIREAMLHRKYIVYTLDELLHI